MNDEMFMVEKEAKEAHTETTNIHLEKQSETMKGLKADLFIKSLLGLNQRWITVKTD